MVEKNDLFVREQAGVAVVTACFPAEQLISTLRRRWIEDAARLGFGARGANWRNAYGASPGAIRMFLVNGADSVCPVCTAIPFPKLNTWDALKQLGFRSEY